MSHTANHLLNLDPLPVKHESQCGNCAFVDDENPTEAEVEARLSCKVCGSVGRNLWTYQTTGAKQKCLCCGATGLPTMIKGNMLTGDKIMCLNCQLKEHGDYCSCGDTSWVASDP